MDDYKETCAATTGVREVWVANTTLFTSFIYVSGCSLMHSGDQNEHHHFCGTQNFNQVNLIIRGEMFIGIHIPSREHNPDYLAILSRSSAKGPSHPPSASTSVLQCQILMW